MRWTSLIAAVACVIVSVGPLPAKVAPARLSELIASSDLIIVGRVTEVSPDAADERYAIVAVDQVWSGNPAPTLRISLTPTWPCDVSRTKLGERAVFFIIKARDGQWHIDHSGHGRMPIVDQQVEVSPMVILSKELTVQNQPQAVALEDMERRVRSEVERLHGRQDQGPAQQPR